jgi:hypothetical protein
MLAAFPLLLLLQEPPPPKEPVKVELSGRIDLHFVCRDAALDETANSLNLGALFDLKSTHFWAGRATLRADIAAEGATGVIEIENRSFDDGQNVELGQSSEVDEIALRQAWIEAADFAAAGLVLRAGVQNVTWRNRPHDEPFFLDLGESEGFNEGFFSFFGAHVRNTADRDVREPVGVHLRYDPFPFGAAHFIAMVYGEGGSSDADETVYAIALNSMLAETAAAWLMGAYVLGAAPTDSHLWSIGAGASGYLGEGRALELFGEAWLQGGTLLPGLDKRAFALNAGARWVGVLDRRIWLEGAFSFRSGNKEIGDDTDEAFQSYENENRFIALQSAEFGLDIDTNVRGVRGAVGFGPIELDGRPLRVQLDVGHFRAVEPVRNASGAPFGGLDWGLEADLSVTWDWSAALSFRVKGALLTGSELLEATTWAAVDRASLLVLGADFRF